MGRFSSTISSLIYMIEDPVDAVGVVNITQYKNRKSNTSFLLLRGRMAEIPTCRRLRKKVKVQFRAKRATNSRHNVGDEIDPSAGRTGMRILLTNFNESKVDDYMLRQPKINVEERECLVDWLLSMHHWRHLDDITAFAAIDIFDRFLSVQVVSMEEVDYVGVAAMHIATKYYESHFNKPLSLDELIRYVNGKLPDLHGLHRYRARIMEKRILEELGWELEVPTVYTFLTQFLSVAKNPPDIITEKMAYFLAKLGILNYHMRIAFPPSMLAAAALYTAYASTCKWRHTFQDCTGFKDTQLFECSKRMVELHRVGPDHENCKWWIPFK